MSTKRKQRRFKFLPFQQARAFAHSLNLLGKDDWELWKQVPGNRPSNIPATPHRVYKNEGWRGWGDWVGTGRKSPAEIGRSKRPFDEAFKFAHSLGLKTQDEWRRWNRSGNRPSDIPADPQDSYKNEGWKGWPHFLGTTTKPKGSIVYREFTAAREWVRSQNLKNSLEWKALPSGALPPDIPARPDHVYRNKGWAGFPDWLGTDPRATTKGRSFKPFEEARDYAISLGFKNQDEWKAFCATGELPLDIPVDPEGCYRNSGWKTWGDFLGTGTIATHQREFLPYEEARALVHSEKFQKKAGFEEWKDRPTNIPRLPSRTYKGKGWRGWGDWLGVHNVWNKTSILAFVSSLVPLLGRFEPSEIYSILRQNGCLKAVDSLPPESPLRRLKESALQEDEDGVQQSLRELGLETLDDEEIDTTLAPPESDEITEIAVPVLDGDADSEARLPNLAPVDILSGLDDLERSVVLSDAETVEFLITKAVGRIWSRVLRSETIEDDIAGIRFHSGGSYGTRVQGRFLAQFDGANSLPLPDGYSFRKKGERLLPNRMQKLIAYRVLTDKRVGNWSGTGAGKTLGAILASRLLGAELTVVVALNNTIRDEKSGWAAEIYNAFPNSHVVIKERGKLSLHKTKPNYLLLNYEAFQLHDSQAFVKALVEKQKIDFIVLDEVHFAKSRGKTESKRRQLINYLLAEAKKANADLRVLAMSATPVINSLDEAVSLLEMTTGHEYPDLNTKAKVSNALAVHEQLVIHGLRYVPRYDIKLHERLIDIDGNDLAERLQAVGKGQVLSIETILTEAKLDKIVELAKPGTIIYSQFVDTIFPMLRERLSDKGFSVAAFSGEDKSGLNEFIGRKADVLIGSSALGTGVDGLQYVCNRLIVNCLPWTSAGYDQLLGRVYRQGSVFQDVDVFIPQVVLRNDSDEWSWDRQRLARIHYKKTLADAAVDGVVPEANLASPELMLDEAKKALDAWIERLSKEEFHEFSRPVLKVPLPPERVREGIRRFGDFSAMNARINSSKSETTHQRFQEHPEEWFLYHTLYREARSTWPEVPFEAIAEWLKKRPDWVVGDFGCGEAELARRIPNKVYSLDHVAVNQSVLVCDMAATGLSDEILDVAVFSLSLMGINYRDYLCEAHRLLRYGGWLKVAESASRWEGSKLEELIGVICTSGFSVVGQPEHRDRFIYLNAIKS